MKPRVSLGISTIMTVTVVLLSKYIFFELCKATLESKSIKWKYGTENEDNRYP